MTALFGDQEITVKIRSNRHCRNGNVSQVGMLIVLCCESDPLGKEKTRRGRATPSFGKGGVFLISFV